MALLGITLLAGAAFVGGYLYRRGLDRRRYRFIQQFRLPPRVAQAVRERYPQLSEEQVQRVLGGLREYCCYAAPPASGWSRCRPRWWMSPGTS